jgi:hypothetical protein
MPISSSILLSVEGRSLCFILLFTRISTLPLVTIRAIATRLYFLRIRGFFLKNAWHFKDIFREFVAFSK